jgi:FkbH-like protein
MRVPRVERTSLHSEQARDSSVTSGEHETAASSLNAAKRALREGKHTEAFQHLRSSAKDIGTLQQLSVFSGLLRALPAETRRLSGLRATNVALAGNGTYKLLGDALTAQLLGHDVVADCYEIPFDQWAQELLNPNSHLYQVAPSFFVFYLSSMGLTRGGTQSFDESALTELLGSVLPVFTSRLKGTQVIFVLPEPLEEELGPVADAYRSRIRFTHELVDVYRDQFVFIDPASLIASIGASKWYAPRFWYTAKMPCHPNAFLPMAEQVGVVISRCLVNPTKVIVCDLDNFLWGGVVGEDGIHGIDLDANATGGAFLRLQYYLKNLKDQGMLLAIASKNNEDDVRAVFGQRQEMILEWNDFVAHRINWRPKGDNIREIADELHLRLEHFCFLDDSPYERAFVRTQLPEVNTPEIPASPEEIVPYFLRSCLFYIPKATEEDKTRTELYRQERQRTGLKSSIECLEDYLNSLNMHVDMIRVGEEQLERVTQLINKTNQFNLTTRRYALEDVRRLSLERQAYIFCCRLRDKFGDSGIVGTMVAVPDGSPDVYRIDTWLLSCRAMGRNVEHAMFHHFLSWAHEHNVKTVVGQYIDSQKNTAVAGLYPSLGFHASDPSSLHVFEYDCVGDVGHPDVSYFQITTVT